MAENKNDLGRLNDLLFAELDRLNSVDPENKDAVALEVSRAKAMQGIAAQVTDSCKVVLDTVRLRAEWSGARVARTPGMLDG